MTDSTNPAGDQPSSFLIYRSPDGNTRIEVRMQAETVWLTQKQLAELFQTSKQNVSLHLQNVFDEGELAADSTVKKYLTVQTEGKRDVSRQIDHYNLQATIAVGYRVRSPRGTQFRIWATDHLREYLVKGFTMDDDRLKRGGGGNYFDELIARIRDIRSSERVFWRKFLDITQPASTTIRLTIPLNVFSKHSRTKCIGRAAHPSDFKSGLCSLTASSVLTIEAI